MSKDTNMTDTENKINETDFEGLSLDSLNIGTVIPKLQVEPGDERAKLFDNHQIAKTLLTSSDMNAKIFFRNKMNDVFKYYLGKVAFNNDKGQYDDILSGMTVQGKLTFFSQMENIKEMIINYVKNSSTYHIEFALNKVIEITKYFIEFINPMYPIILDLDSLGL